MQAPLYIRTLASSSTNPGQASAKKGFFKEIMSSSAAIPIGAIGGFVMIAGYLAVHTATQQVLHSPSIQVNKAMRGMPEVDFPDTAIKSANKLQNKSHLRKVGHIQDTQYAANYKQVTLSRAHNCETLKAIGVPTRED